MPDHWGFKTYQERDPECDNQWDYINIAPFRPWERSLYFEAATVWLQMQILKTRFNPYDADTDTFQAYTHTLVTLNKLINTHHLLYQHISRLGMSLAIRTRPLSSPEELISWINPTLELEELEPTLPLDVYLGMKIWGPKLNNLNGMCACTQWHDRIGGTEVEDQMSKTELSLEEWMDQESVTLTTPKSTSSKYSLVESTPAHRQPPMTPPPTSHRRKQREYRFP